MRILVLGVGNILLTDEAIGVRIVEALEQRYILPDYVEILDGGTGCRIPQRCGVAGRADR